jgi:hypothetical protein
MQTDMQSTPSHTTACNNPGSDVQDRRATFADTVAKQLFQADNDDTPVNRTHDEHDNLSKLTVLAPRHTSEASASMHNAEPPGKKIRPKPKPNQGDERGRPSARQEWQTVGDRKASKGSRKQRTSTEVPSAPRPPPTQELAPTPVKRQQPIPMAIDESSDDVRRLEEQSSLLAKRNAELAELLAENTRMLQELELQNSAITKAVDKLTRTKREAEEAAAAAIATASHSAEESSPITMAVEQDKTPEKKRTSKKSSLVISEERTPPKPPEGTPQKKKKKKVSNSPASQPNSNPNIDPTTNRYEPLMSEASDDEDSFADAIEVNVLATVDVTGESAVNDGHKATATPPSPPSTNSETPGFGSNGVGSTE